MIESFECPLCFIFWEEGEEDEEDDGVIERYKEKKCSFCHTNNPTGKVLLERMIEVIPKARPSKLPKLLLFFYSICDIK